MKNLLKLFTLSFLLVSNLACDTTEEDVDTSTVSIYLHDSPALYDALNLHIHSVSVVNQGDGESVTIGEPDEVINILELVNGNKFLMGEGAVEPGRYSHIIIELGNENSVVLDGQEHQLAPPADNRIEIRNSFNIGSDETMVLSVDIDASASVVYDGGYMLDPSVRVYEESEGKIVAGSVHPDHLQANLNLRRSYGARTVFTSTHTENNTGEFKFMGVGPDVYDVVVTPGTDEYNPVTHKFFSTHRDDEEVPLGTVLLGESELLNTGEGWFRRELSPGVELLEKHFDNFDGVQRHIHILAIDTGQPDIELGIYIPQYWGNSPHRAPISDFGEHAMALAATNAGFAPGGADYFNYGIIKIDGEVFPYVQKGTDDHWDELLVDRYFFGSSAVGIDYDGKWHFRQREGDTWDDDWPEMRHAIAGGHRVLIDGEIMENIEQGTYRHEHERRHMMTQHPRTALCHTSDEVVALFAIDGRFDEAVGMSLLEMAEFMLDLGCVDAINFDGGGSTTMWTREHGVVNHPTDNSQFDHEGQRNLRNAIIIRDPN